MDQYTVRIGVRMVYPERLKDEARARFESGMGYRQIAALPGMPSRMTVWRWVNGALGDRTRREREEGRMDLPKVVGDGPVYPDIDPDDKDALIERLRLENEVLRAVNEVLKAGSLGSLTNREKTLLIDHLRRTTGRRLGELTDFLRISKSSYEYQRGAIARGDKYAWLRPLVAEEFHAEGDARGYRVVTWRLRHREEPVVVSEKVVRDIMREDGLRVRTKKSRRYSSYAGELDAAPDNLPLLGDGTHDFHADAPNEKWVTDITEFRLPDDTRKVYLSPVVDLYDTKPVAWSISLRPDAELANSSLRAACATLAPGERPWCHSDRGCHYRWPGWKRICEENGIVRSMSRKGCSPDNAAGEGFFGRLKNEFFHGRDWHGVTAEEFMALLDGWMRFYSEGRLKLFVGEDGRKYYDTIDNRRRRLGLAA